MSTETSTAPATVAVEIVSRWDAARVLFRAEVDASIPVIGRIKAALEIAVSRGASLVGASLDGARLDGARLVGARLVGARLVGASLVGARLDGARLDGASLDGASLDGAKITTKAGETATLNSARPVLQIGPIGSRNAMLMVYRTDLGVLAQTGCFGPAPLTDFEAAVTAEHGDGEHGAHYRAAVALARVMLEEVAA